MTMRKQKPTITRKMHLYLALFLLISLPVFFILIKIKNEINLSGWDGQGSINIVWITKPLILSSYDPNSHKITLFIFPENLYADVAGDKGRYKLENIWKLGLLENRRNNLFLRTAENLMGIPINGFVMLNNSQIQISDQINKEKILEFRNQNDGPNILLDIMASFFGSDKTRIKSNLSSFNLLSFWQQMKKIKSQDISIINLGEFQITHKFSLPDKSQGLLFDSKTLDNLTSGYLSDKKISDENLSIEIKNAAGIQGLGNELSRYINNLGAQVVRIENDSEKNQSLCLVISNQQKSYTLAVIKKITECQIQVKESKETDITVVLGKNVSNRF